MAAESLIWGLLHLLYFMHVELFLYAGGAGLARELFGPGWEMLRGTRQAQLCPSREKMFSTSRERSVSALLPLRLVVAPPGLCRLTPFHRPEPVYHSGNILKK